MTIHLSIEVNKPVSECWRVLGEEFSEIDKWASSISKSTAKGNSFKNAACSQRECVVGKSIFVERLTEFDSAAHSLSYDIVQGAPPFVAYANNTWSLLSKGPGSTLQMALIIKTKGVSGLLLGPILKLVFQREFKKTLRDFKTYVENRTNQYVR